MKLKEACGIIESWDTCQASWNVIHYWYMGGQNIHEVFGENCTIFSVLWENLPWALIIKQFHSFQIFWLNRFLSKTINIFHKHYFFLFLEHEMKCWLAFRWYIVWKYTSFKIFICFWLFWVCVATHRLSLVAVSGGYSLLLCGFLIVVPSVVVEHGP